MIGLMDPVVIVHQIDHVRRAVAAAQSLHCPVVLLSAPGAAASLGPAVFRGMIETVIGEMPALSVTVTAVIDCGSDAGHALKALQEGCRQLRLDADESVLTKLRDIAGGSGIILSGEPLAALDLADPKNKDAALHAWLTKSAARH